ncbi:sulfatase [Paenibacillus sp. 1P07SE]|uniref:sulfatase family protein n=1 Tax=Paenibacillus sp. 1P07SE TaxID=3132209 RepID=UPI0039A5A406
MNVLLITPDQMRADAMGCSGHPIVRTPHLDRLAGEGIRYEQCHVHNWVCAPSRATIVTGAHPSVHGVLFNDMTTDLRLETVPELFRRAGYRTGHVGKWHHYPKGEAFGFETILAHDGYREYLAAQGIDPALGEEYPADWTKQFSTWVSPIPEAHYLTVYETDQAIAYLDEPSEKPFFLWLSYEKPHPPYNPPASYAGMYEPAAMPLPAGWDGLQPGAAPHKQADSAEHWRTGVRPAEMTDTDIQLATAHYYASISLVDAQIGRLLAHLEQRGWMKDTMIVFTSDHGEMMGDHRLLNKGPYPYDALTHVPLIIYNPRLPQERRGTVEGRLVGQEDAVATLLDAAKLDPAPHMTGRSLLAALEREGEIVPGVSGHHYGPHYNVNIRTWRTEDYRYTLYHYADEASGAELAEELYDLRADPSERYNVIGDDSYAAVASRMRRELIADTMRREQVKPEVREIRERFASAGGRGIGKTFG